MHSNFVQTIERKIVLIGTVIRTVSTLDAKQETTSSSPVEMLNSLVAHPQRPSLWRLLWIWFLLGLQSFGGGAATLFLIRRTAVDEHHWLSAEDFTRDWALVQAAPGINLLCMTILVGRQVAGLGGAVVALVGLLLPSVSITIVMTALYADLRDLPVIQAALHGVVPATVGLGLVLTYRLVMPLLSARRREGRWLQMVYILIFLGSAVAMLLWQLPVLVVLLSAGAIGGLSQWLHSAQTKMAQTKVGQP
jgi:chromate transporter